MDHVRKMKKAVSKMMLSSPFFGVLALRLRLIPNENIPTACTDGRVILYNPDFVMKQDIERLKGLIAHEVMHPLMFHTTRRQKRDPKKWNMACDYAINPILLDSDFLLPEGGLVDREYKDMNAEQIGRLPPGLIAALTQQFRPHRELLAHFGYPLLGE